MEDIYLSTYNCNKFQRSNIQANTPPKYILKNSFKYYL